MWKPVLAVVALVFGLMLSVHTEMADGANPAEMTDAYVGSALAKQKIPGLSMGVVRDGRLIYAKAYGLSDVELNVPAASDSVYEIGSITKDFTATAIMMLVEEKKVGLDDPISKHLKQLPGVWKNITIRDLLTHTSGIRNYLSVPNFANLALRPTTPDELLRLVGKDPLRFEPGEKWEYSNTGYCILGLLIEQAGGESYAEFLRKRIFLPLGMTATRVNDLARIIPGRAAGYQLENGELRNAPRWDPTCAGAAGALISNVPDLAKWVAAQDSAQVLSKSSVELMRSPAKLRDGRLLSYGFGCLVSSINGHRMIRYTGGIPGFITTIVDYPDDGLAVIVLTNLITADAEGIAVHIGGIYDPRLDYRPIADAEPQVTEMIRKTFAAWAEGKVTDAAFAPDFWKTLNSRPSPGGKTLLEQNAASLRDHGPIRAIKLLQREERENRFYRYRIDYEKTSRLMWFDVDDEGKIVSFGAQPVSN